MLCTVAVLVHLCFVPSQVVAIQGQFNFCRSADVDAAAVGKHCVRFDGTTCVQQSDCKSLPAMAAALDMSVTVATSIGTAVAMALTTVALSVFNSWIVENI